MTLIEAVKGTYAVIGQETTDLQLAMIVEELTAYPIPDVLVALSRCRKELRKMTMMDILDRLPGGHPGPEEAWSLVSRCLNNEQISVVWTDEMREAYGAACALVDDSVAARMAFKEVYSKRVSEARAKQQGPSWSVSLGYDPRLREVALADAVQKNQISAAHAARLGPPSEPLHDTITHLTGLIGNT